MLVLSRKNKDSIRLPELDISIEILQVKGKSVRVGIDAPIEVTVLRGELEDEVAQKFSISGVSDHEVRNKLNSLNLAVAVAKKLIQKGEFHLAAEKLHNVLAEFEVASRDDESCPTTTALLVEDSDNEREMLAGFLRLHGYQVDTVVDGVEAISYLESNEKPDFILMDIRLPRMNGVETIQRIRENPAFDKVEIFAVSGESARQAGINPKKNRVAKWFQKPLQPAMLVSTINTYFSTPNYVSN